MILRVLRRLISAIGVLLMFVIGLVSGHVAAKRYLVATREGYMDRLSPTSKTTLELQGGPMSAAEVTAFEASLYYRDLLRLRSWDEQAKDPDMQVPGLTVA